MTELATNTDTEPLADATCSAVRVLRLTLKRKWFDMIACGEKKEEYRTKSKWIESRLIGKHYDVIEFKNGYGKNVPTILVEFKGWLYGEGVTKWGAVEGQEYYVILLGRVLQKQND